MQRMRVLAQLVLSGTAGPCDELEYTLLRGPTEDDVDATPEGYLTYDGACASSDLMRLSA